MNQLESFDVSSFPFSPSVIKKLIENGFKTIEDFDGVGLTDLTRECNILPKEALEVLDYIKGDSGKKDKEYKNALDLLGTKKSHIITFCKEIDEMMGSGIPCGSLTEFCGLPGIGKTQFGLQLCVNVQLPKEFGGLEGKAIYLDTEGSFVPERAEQIAKYFLTILNETQDPFQKEKVEKLSTEKILSNILYYRIHSYIEQISIINVLPSFLEQNKDVKLIVLDSVAFHFRMGFEDMSLRTRILNGMAKNLSFIANQYNLSIIIMNQVTTKVSENKTTSIIPALGESWSHACTYRLFLYWKGSERCARLFKSPVHKEQTVSYHITQEGVRSLDKKREREEDDDELNKKFKED